MGATEREEKETKRRWDDKGGRAMLSYCTSSLFSIHSVSPSPSLSVSLSACLSLSLSLSLSLCVSLSLSLSLSLCISVFVSLSLSLSLSLSPSLFLSLSLHYFNPHTTVGPKYSKSVYASFFSNSPFPCIS